MQITESLTKRFRKRVQKGGSCWLWTGGTIDGYGKMFGGLENDGKTLLAHRVSYCLHIGDPGCLLVCHDCNTPLCVNPDHLFLGSHSDNQKHASETGIHSQLKLCESQIEDILYLSSMSISQQEIAQKHGVSRSYISMLVSGKRRTHV